MSARTELADFPRPYGVRLAEEQREQRILAEHRNAEARALAEAKLGRPLNLYFDGTARLGEILDLMAAYKAEGYRFAPVWIRNERGDPCGLQLIGVVR